MWADAEFKRFDVRAKRPVNLDTFVAEDPGRGLVAMDSAKDPTHKLTLVQGQIVEMDGREKADFDTIDCCMTTHSIDCAVAEEAMAIPSLTLTRSLLEIITPRSGLVGPLSGCTPAKLCQIMTHLNGIELMMAMQKMRARRTPGNQVPVTNWRKPRYS